MNTSLAVLIPATILLISALTKKNEPYNDEKKALFFWGLLFAGLNLINWIFYLMTSKERLVAWILTTNIEIGFFILLIGDLFRILLLFTVPKWFFFGKIIGRFFCKKKKSTQILWGLIFSILFITLLVAEYFGLLDEFYRTLAYLSVH